MRCCLQTGRELILLFSTFLMYKIKIKISADKFYPRCNICHNNGARSSKHKHTLCFNKIPCRPQKNICFLSPNSRNIKLPLTSCLRQTLFLDAASRAVHTAPENRWLFCRRRHCERLYCLQQRAVYQNFTGFAERYFFTIRAILNTIAWSNSRRSRPVSFFIFSSL